MENDTPLHVAIWQDNHLLLQSELKEISIADYREDDGANLLHLSARCGNSCMTKYFIQAGCDVNAQDNKKNTPLLYAIYNVWKEDRLPLVKILLEAGARVDIKNSDEENALHACISIDSDDRYDDLDCAKVLLDAGANVNIKGTVLRETPLHRAAGFLRNDSVDFLLNHGADPNVKNDEGETALHATASPSTSHNHQAQVNILRSLLSHGGIVNFHTNDNQTPLHYALRDSSKEAIQLLLEHGADLKIKDFKGRGPMHYAAENNDVNVLRFVLNNGYTTNELDENGKSPLCKAVKRGMVQNIIFLHKNGANMNVEDFDGMTPLHKLIDSHKNNNSDYILNDVNVELLVDLLIDLGANVNALTAYDQTLFDLAMEAEHCSSQYFIIKLLAKMEFVGKEIDDILWEDIESEEKYMEYYDKCLAELTIIKDYVFYDVTPIFPVFMGDQKIITRYVKNNDLVKAFKAKNFSEIFPIYGKGIKARFNVKRAERELRTDALQLLREVLPEQIRNELIIKNIIDYLNDSDLVQLMKKPSNNKYYIHHTTKYLFINEVNTNV